MRGDMKRIRTIGLVIAAGVGLATALLIAGWWFALIPDPSELQMSGEAQIASRRSWALPGFSSRPNPASHPDIVVQRQELDAQGPWSNDVEDRVTALLSDYADLHRVTCIPEPADFEPPHIVDIVQQKPTALPWVALPNGGFIVEAPTETGHELLKTASGPVRVRWNIAQTPNCTLSPAPSRWARLTVDAVGEDLTIRWCSGTQSATTGEEVELLLEGGSIEATTGAARCQLALAAAGVVTHRSIVDLDAPGLAEVVWDEVPVQDEGTVGEADPFDRVAYLERRLDRARQGKGPVFDTIAQQIDVLEYLIRSDPTLKPVLQPRLDERKTQRTAWAERIVESLEDQLDEARP